MAPHAALRTFALPLWLLLAVASCASPPQAPRHVVRELSLQAGFITGVVKIPTIPPGPRPAVLRPIVADELLLARGIAVVHYHVNWQMLAPLADGTRDEPGVAPDAEDAPAPERVGRWLLAAADPRLVGADYFCLIGAEAGQAVPAVLDHLVTWPELDPERVGIGGSSTAGFVAFETFHRDPRVAVAVVRVACGDYHAFLRDSSLALDGREDLLEEGQIVLEDDYAAELRSREPIRSPRAFPPRPLLMLNGAGDRAVPVSCARQTAEVLADAYREAGVPERFRFVVLEDRAHDLGPEADREVLAWWERWLLDP